MNKKSSLPDLNLRTINHVSKTPSPRAMSKGTTYSINTNARQLGLPIEKGAKRHSVDLMGKYDAETTSKIS